MGCISSRRQQSFDDPHLYRVVNIDSDGNSICSGNMTLNRAELTLHCENREPMHWPLSGLRRYGCEPNVFSIEAGRHCQCAEGTYSFRCERAHQLFLTLQMYIQNPLRSAHFQPNVANGGGSSTTGAPGQPYPGHPARPRTGAASWSTSSRFNGNVAPAPGHPADNAELMRLHHQQQQQQQLLLQQQRMSLAVSPTRAAMQPIGGGGAAASGPMRNHRHSSSLPVSNFTDARHLPGPMHPLASTMPIADDNQSAGAAAAGGGGGNLYQECAMAASTTTFAAAAAAAASNGGTFESNNNQVQHNSKQLSLDIPPAEPAPSPISALHLCTSPSSALPLSPTSSAHHNSHHHHHLYHNELSAGAGLYVNAIDQPPQSADRLYCNVSAGSEHSASAGLLSPSGIPPETPRFPQAPHLLGCTPILSPTATITPTTPLTPGAPPPSVRVFATEATPLGATTPLLWSDCEAHRLDSEAESRPYANLDLPLQQPTPTTSGGGGGGVLQRRLQQQQHPHAAQQLPNVATRRTSSSSLSSAPLPAGLRTTPTSPLSLTTEQLQQLAGEPPSSPGMLYITLDLDHSAAATASAQTPAASTATTATTPTTHAATANTMPGASYQRTGSNSSANVFPPSTSAADLAVLRKASLASASATSIVMAASSLPPDSPKHAGIMDYAQIDFNKTLALSNSTQPSTALDSEESRRTRHSSSAAAVVAADPASG